MNRLSIRILHSFIAVALFAAVAAESSADLNGLHVTLTNESATGYDYSGSGSNGLPGTADPDSRRRPKIFNDFSPFDASAVGSTLSMSYDILWGGDADPSNESQDWRFGFISTSANGGKGETLGANFDIGNLAGSTAYEFFIDQAVTTGEGTPVSGEMDSAFTNTLNPVGDEIARFAQSNDDPYDDDVAFNDRTDTHRVTLNLERIADGYSLSMSWQNLVSGNTINHSTTIDTSDFDPVLAQSAGVTTWDRLGFFVNDNNIDDAGPWTYALTNVSVEGDGSPLQLSETWSANAYQTIPEPTSLWLALIGAVALRVRRRRSQ